MGTMSFSIGSHARCDRCGSRSEIEEGLKIAVQSDGDEAEWFICGDCSEIDCGQCGARIPVRSALLGELIRESGQFIECVRCGTETLDSNAVLLRHKQHNQYRKLICGDCFKDITVPSEYTVIRDFSPDKIWTPEAGTPIVGKLRC